MAAVTSTTEARASHVGGRAFVGTWLFSRNVDLGAFLGAAALSLALLAFGRMVGIKSTPAWTFVLCVVMVDVAHVHSTVFRVYLDRAEVARRKALYLGTPIVAYAIGALLHQFGGAGLFWRCLAYLAVFHFIRQQVGWVALYRARAREHEDEGRRIDAWLDPAATYVAAIYPLLAWHASLPKKFWWFFAGDFAPVVPRWVATAARPIWLALLVAFVGRQLVLAVQRRGVNVGKCVVVLTTFLLWWVGIVAFDSDYAFTVTNVLPHGIPYFVLVAAYARRRYEDRQAPEAKVATSILRHGFVVAYGLLVAVALIEEGIWDRFVWHDHEQLFGEGQLLGPRALGFLVPLLALPQAVHYVLDGAIWSRTSNPQLGRYLSPTPAATSEPS